MDGTELSICQIISALILGGAGALLWSSHPTAAGVCLTFAGLCLVGAIGYFISMKMHR
jgi:hypothetical protein